MADLKISALNSLAGADLVAADVVAVVDDSASETKKLTVSDLIANGVTLISNSTIPSAKILFSAGSVATASVADAGITTAKVADSSITAAKLADNSSVTLVSTLPGSGDFTGQIALDTDDNKIYIWDGSAWDSVKGAGSINVVNGSTSGIVNITTSTSGDTVTVSTTLDDTSSAAQFLAGPTGSGGTVGYRAIIGTDLPTASSSAKGGVIVNGNGLAMSGETITVNNSVTAETSENHLVQYDANGLITGGRAIVAGDVPVATSSATGAVKPGSGLEVTGAGAINHSNSVSAATAAKVTFDAQGHITASEALAASDVPDLDAAKITTGTLPTARLANDAVTADKLGDKSTTTIAETTPAGGSFIGQGHLNSISGDFLIWDGNVWQPIGVSVGEIVLAGTYNASTNKMATVTSEGTSLSYVVGSALPAASASNKGYYVVVSTAGTGTSPAPTVALNPPDFLLSTGTAYTEIDVSSTVIAQQASNVAFTAAGNISATNVQSAIEELDSEKVRSASPTFTGTVALGEDAVITFEGATDNAFETTLTVVDPTADRTVSLPNVTGTLISSGDTGSVTSAMIADGAIVNADINASAEIAVSKLANGTARQLLQTDAAGSGVEFTSNIDVPGTLDVTGAATLDSTLGVTGLISADGKVKFPAGSASAPSFYSGTDTNTGLYFSAADEVSITTGGTQRVVVDSSGRLLVGTTSGTYNIESASSNALKLVNGSTYDLRFVDQNSLTNIYSYGSQDLSINTRYSNNIRFKTNDGERMRIDSSGRVLIGTTTAGAFTNRRLSIATSSGTTALELRSATDGDSRIVFTDSTSSSDTGAYKGQIAYDQTSDYMSFNTNGNNERLRIDSSGNVGIGTSSPSAPLHVSQNAAQIALFQRPSGSSNVTVKSSASTTLKLDGTDSILAFVNAGGATPSYTIGRDNTDNTLRISQNSSAPGTNDLVTINSSGNVGIGTTSPSRILHVNSGATNEVARFESSDTEVTVEFKDPTGTASLKCRNDYRFNNSSGELIRIDSSGNVGIGESNPAFELDVASSDTTTVNITAGTTDISRLFFSDTTVGRGYLIYDHSSDSMSFATAGSERARIDSSGRMLLGTTTEGDSGADDLTIANSGGCGITIRSGTTSYGALYFSDATSGSGEYDGYLQYNQSSRELAIGTASATRMLIDSSGRVLVGTSSASVNSRAIFQGRSDNAAVNTDIHFQRGQTNPASGSVLGRFIFADNASSPAAYIQADADGTWGSSDYPGRLVFSTTADGTSNPTERLRITSTGAWAIEGASNYGTSGQVLTSNGNDSPTWQDASGGGASTDLGAVGTYAFCHNASNKGSAGATRSGSELKFTDAAGTYRSGDSSPSGTWRRMGYQEEDGATDIDGAATLWVRIS